MPEKAAGRVSADRRVFRFAVSGKTREKARGLCLLNFCLNWWGGVLIGQGGWRLLGEVGRSGWGHFGLCLDLDGRTSE